MKVVGMIPVRMGSYRYPGKPLCDICGITMTEHVYRRSEMSEALDETYVVTCNTEIEEEVKRFGGRCLMTPDTFNRCTDRIAYAVKEYDMEGDIFVVIQGDEPLLYPDMITSVVRALQGADDAVAGCLYTKILSDEEFEDPNEIKVVKTVDDYVLYFSRAGIPSKKLAMETYDRYKQVCLMPYRRDFLLKFPSMLQTPLETVESVDMCRIIENGYRIKLAESTRHTYAIDVPADREKVVALMEKDALFPKYKR